MHFSADFRHLIVNSKRILALVAVFILNAQSAHAIAITEIKSAAGADSVLAETVSIQPENKLADPTDIAAQTNPSLKLSLWSEFVPYAVIESHLAEFKRANISVFVAFSEERADYDGFVHLQKAAQQAGVEIRPWLLLSEEHGYWFSKWNVDESEAFVWTFMSEMEKRQQKVDWLIFDVEPPHSLTDKVQADLQHKNVVAALKDLRKSSRDHSLKEARDRYITLLGKLKEKSIRVKAVTSNFVLNDLRDHSAKIQSALGIPIAGVPWDEVSFMVYRAEFEKIIGSMNSKIILKYGKIAQKYFGESAAIDLGEYGKVLYPHPFSGFSSAEDLQSDIAEARAAGIGHVNIYSLDGLLDKGIDYWTAPAVTSIHIKSDIKSTLFLDFFSVMREFLPHEH